MGIKKMFLLSAMTVAVFAAAFGAFAQTEPMSDKTALEFLQGSKAGWNLGNTMDAFDRASNKAVEGCWGAGEATQALLNGVMESGFDAVRIPVTWTGHIGGAPDYTISTERLQRVAEIIGYARTAGAKAIIINIHHDGHATDHNSWLKLSAAESNAAKKDELQGQIVKMWTQIANYFKDYGDYLIFETLNEIHNGNWGWGTWTSAAYQNQQDILFDWNSAALGAIRATGGNNATRYVAVPGLGSNEPVIVNEANKRGKLLPPDGNNGTSRLIVSVHYYAPSDYTVNGPKTNEWGSTAELKELSDNVGTLKANYTSQGIAVYIGEWGAPTGQRRNLSDDIKNTHINYIKSVAEATAKNDVLTFLWDDGGNFKLLERSNGKPAAGFATEVLGAIKEGLDERDGHTAINTPRRGSAGVQGAAPLVTLKGRTLNVNAADSKVRVKIVNMAGKTVANFNASGSAKLPLNKIPAGAYIIEAKRMKDGYRTMSAVVLR